MLNFDKSILDHRFFSERLDLYFFDKKMQGLPFLLSNWVEIRNSIQSIIRYEWMKNDFNEVITPVLANKEIYETSGHLDHYKDYIFPELKNNEQESYYLRPMTCPHHCLVYKKKVMSYRDLPLKICENSLLHRYESSGSLKGLERARCMELVDHHIFVDFSRLKKELKNAYYFSEKILRKFNFSIDRVVLAVHDNVKKKYHDFVDIWKKSEGVLFEVLSEMNVKFSIEKDEAAFYGPKIDLEVKSDIDGKFLSISTIQVDFYLPSKFDLIYTNNNGIKDKVIMIHHSPIGTYQRFIALFLEKNSKKLPFWISPVQLAILPINNDNEELISYSNILREIFLESGIKAKIFLKKTSNYRIKAVYDERIPYYILIGREELKIKKMKIKDCQTGFISEYLNIKEILLILNERKSKEMNI